MSSHSRIIVTAKFPGELPQTKKAMFFIGRQDVYVSLEIREGKHLPLAQVVQVDLGFHVSQADPGRGANENSTSNYRGFNLRWQIFTLGAIISMWID